MAKEAVMSEKMKIGPTFVGASPPMIHTGSLDGVEIKWSDQQDPDDFSPTVDLCTDFDGDCFFVENKAACYEYAPEQGMCPWRKR